jgi:hypothetical protein
MRGDESLLSRIPAQSSCNKDTKQVHSFLSSSSIMLVQNYGILYLIIFHQKNMDTEVIRILKVQANYIGAAVIP